MAQAPYRPSDQDRQTVETMAGIGLVQREIAAIMGILRPTLAAHFAQELELGAVKAQARVLQALFALATSGRDTTATIFWLRVIGSEQAVERMGKKARELAEAQKAHEVDREWADLVAPDRLN